MNINVLQRKKNKIAVVEAAGLVIITGVQAAMDLMTDVLYHYGCDTILIHRKNICPEFFDLSTRLAGEILQKYTTYHVKIAIIGNFDDASSSLKDFIRECNKGNQIFFLPTQQEALQKLCG